MTATALNLGLTRASSSVLIAGSSTIATHILAFEGESHVEWFEGNFQDYEKDKMRRLGQDSIIPHRVKYKKLTR
jgi:hypothetical protein